MKWAEDNTELFAMMEKTRMYIFRNLDPEVRLRGLKKMWYVVQLTPISGGMIQSWGNRFLLKTSRVNCLKRRDQTSSFQSHHSLNSELLHGCTHKFTLIYRLFQSFTHAKLQTSLLRAPSGSQIYGRLEGLCPSNSWDAPLLLLTYGWINPHVSIPLHLHQQEPILSSGYICHFENLQITSVLLDEILKTPPLLLLTYGWINPHVSISLPAPTGTHPELRLHLSLWEPPDYIRSLGWNLEDTSLTFTNVWLN